MIQRKIEIYLSTPINALVEGIYEENIPMTEIKKHGDFGLGTFNQLDGEMVLLDGQIYRIASDGNVSIMDEQTQTPFACVTFYQAMSYEDSEGELKLSRVSGVVDCLDALAKFVLCLSH